MASPPDDAAQSPLRAGDILVGKYRVERQIGRGGMGIVLAATHLQLEHQVAIKVLRRDLVEGDKALSRLLAEARAAAKIRSEHVARVLDVGTLEDGAPFIVMEYLEGEDLADLLDRQGALDVTMAVQFMLQSCEALAEVHAAEMVHRDLKPGNLFVAKLPDGSPSLKIVDFGISKHIGDAARGNPSTTTSSTVLGSPYYMPPEQMRAEPVDERSDIWSLGAILFEMLTGRPPFLGDTLPEVYAAVLSGTVQPVSSLRPDIPQGLDDIVQRCLDKDPNQRFEDVAELAEALRPYGGVTSAQSVERVARILNNPQLFRGRASPVPRAGEAGVGAARGGVGLEPPPLAPSPVLDIGPPSSLPEVPTMLTPEPQTREPAATERAAPGRAKPGVVTPGLVTPGAASSFGPRAGSSPSLDLPLSATAQSGGPFTELAPARGKAGLRAAWGAVAFAVVLVGGALWMRFTSSDSAEEPAATPLPLPSRVDVPPPTAVQGSGSTAATVANAPAVLQVPAAAKPATAPGAVAANPAAANPGAARPAAAQQPAEPAPRSAAHSPAVSVEALRPAPAAPAVAARRAEPEPEKKAKPAPTPVRAAPRRAPRATAPRKPPPQNGPASSSGAASSKKASSADPWNPSSFGDRH